MTTTNIDLGWENISGMMLNMEASLQRLEGVKKNFQDSHTERMSLVQDAIKRIESFNVVPVETIMEECDLSVEDSTLQTLVKISNDLDDLLASL